MYQIRFRVEQFLSSVQNFSTNEKNIIEAAEQQKVQPNTTAGAAAAAAAAVAAAVH